ncbi:MAG: caspase family protein, partial [Pseudomonadota bacterium]|nr:caspase family protein [Pseudomonadota bacterium]
MARRAFKLVLLAIGIAIAAASAEADERRFALVIGNGDYRHAGSLPNPVNDARLVAQAFEAVGFETRLLLDLDENAMGEAIDALSAKVGELDVAAVYYAGHGLQKDGRNFLVPVDADIETEGAIERESIGLDSIIDALERVPVSLLFLDACRNNPFAEQIAASAQASGRSVRVTRGLAVVRPVGDMLITFATLPNTIATDGAGDNSPFAMALAQHVRTPDTEVSVLMKRVTRDVIQ